MKKAIIITTLLLCVLSGCVSSSSKDEGEPLELTSKELINKINDPKNNSFLVYIKTDKCYSCDEFEKVVTTMQKAQPFPIYYLLLDMDEQENSVKKDLEELSAILGDFHELPTTYYFKEGTLLPENIKPGYMQEKEFETWLKKLQIRT